MDRASNDMAREHELPRQVTGCGEQGHGSLRASAPGKAFSLPLSRSGTPAWDPSATAGLGCVTHATSTSLCTTFVLFLPVHLVIGPVPLRDHGVNRGDILLQQGWMAWEAWPPARGPFDLILGPSGSDRPRGVSAGGVVTWCPVTRGPVPTSPHSTAGPDFHIGSSLPGQAALPGPGLSNVRCDPLRFAINSAPDLSGICQGFRCCVVKYLSLRPGPGTPASASMRCGQGSLPIALAFCGALSCSGSPRGSLLCHSASTWSSPQNGTCCPRAHRRRLAHCRLPSSDSETR